MKCEHYKRDLVDTDRYYINSEEHSNCVLCLINDKGPMTQDVIANYFRSYKNENLSA